MSKKKYSINTPQETTLDIYDAVLDEFNKPIYNKFRNSKHFNDFNNEISYFKRFHEKVFNHKSSLQSKERFPIIVAVFEHSTFPNYLRNVHNVIYELKHNKMRPENKPYNKLDDYIFKIPENVTIIDFIDAGGLTCANADLEYNLLLHAWYNKIIKNDINKYVIPHSNIRKYIKKNLKLYFEGDYYINFQNSFERSIFNIEQSNVANWGIQIKDTQDKYLDFQLIENTYKHTNESIQNKVRELGDKINELSERNQEYNGEKIKRIVTTSDLIEKLQQIFGHDRNIILSLISCRKFPRFYKENYKLYSHFLAYANMIDLILYQGKLNAQLQKNKLLRHRVDNSHDSYRNKKTTETPINYKEFIYNRIFRIDNLNRTFFIKNKQELVNKFIEYYNSYYYLIINNRTGKNHVPKPKLEIACPEDKILNPATKRCVSKKGAIGKKLMNVQLKTQKKTSSKTNLVENENKDIMKVVSICPPDKILNPETRRCVSKKGAIGKKLMKNQMNITKKHTISKQLLTKKLKLVENKEEPSSKRTQKKCPEDKILNPKTNRCVSKKGAIGKKLLNQ